MRTILQTLILAFVLLIPMQLHAQTGKIVGSVSVKETGEPIIAADVVVVGTNRGAATDLDGEFFILRVDSGTYTIWASAVGYAPVIIKDVEVKENRTVDLEIEMKSSLIGSEGGILWWPTVHTGQRRGASSHTMGTGAVLADWVLGPMVYNEPFQRSQSHRGHAEDGNEGYRKTFENPFLRAQVLPVVTLPAYVNRASYPSIRGYLTSNQLPPRDAVRLEECVNYFNYDYPAPRQGEVLAIDSELSDCPWNAAHQLLRIGLCATDKSESHIVAKDVNLQIEFNPYYVGGYRPLGYEKHLLAARDSHDDTKVGRVMEVGHRVTALYEIIPATDEDRAKGEKSELRYQKQSIVKSAKKNSELATIAFRHKEQEGTTSKRTDFPVSAELLDQTKVSDNFLFAAAVAEFALLLGESEYSGDATYDQVISLAREGRGEDPEGYRAEFIMIAERAKILSDQMKKQSESERYPD